MLAVVVVSCGGGFGKTATGRRLVVTLTAGDRGAPEQPLPLSFSKPHLVTVRIEARRADDTLDTGFDGMVRLSAKPGSVLPVETPAGRTLRNARLVGGVADGVQVALVAAYGETRIWAEDEGNVPTDPLRPTPPACSNGVDDDGDGDADFPLDVGCASPVDDTEVGGSFIGGVSEPLFFVRPRIADVRGDESRGAQTPFSAEQVDVDTGYRATTNQFAFDVVVTRIASDGFYATDLDPNDKRPYRSVYAFTFNSPQRMRVCDRIKTLTGTATEFFGMTQLASPTFTVEFWNPNRRPCLVPEPRLFTLDDVSNTGVLFENAAGLVRVADSDDVALTAAALLGPNSPERQGDQFTFTRDATNCDVNRNGRIDFGAGSAEQLCADQCAANIDCSEWTAFRDQRNFMLALRQKGGPRTAKIQADASAAPAFDPLAARGQSIGAFTGTLKYFSGGSQFTIEVRCDKDVVPAGQAPFPSDDACVNARTDVDNEAIQ